MNKLIAYNKLVKQITTLADFMQLDTHINNVYLQRIKFSVNYLFVYASFSQCLLCMNDYLFP